MLLHAIVIAVAGCAAPSLDPADAKHLLGRTGFGPTRADIEALAPLTREQAVDDVIGTLRESPTTAAPTFGELLPRAGKGASPEERRVIREQRIGEAIELKTWWANEMLVTTSPFTERMVLFWSNHFTSSVQKVKAPQLLWEQNELYRSEGTGSFAKLLRDVVDDRAMLLYLDGAKNEAKAPNENFARELLELFTLGEGHYTEHDVQEAARALTGTTLAPRRRGIVVTPPFRHDGGEKTFLGVTGNLDKNDVVAILLKNPRTAELIVEKLWREFISPDPDPRDVKRLAGGFRASGYEMKPLLRALLTSDAFWSAKNRGSLVKSPVDLVVGAARSLELTTDGDGDPSPAYVAKTLRSLGQDLFDPPNVKGWPGGDRWITTMTLPDRERLAREAVAATKLRSDDKKLSLAALLLPLPASAAEQDDLEAIARDPAFQLK